jgi:hypothetical protein
MVSLHHRVYDRTCHSSRKEIQNFLNSYHELSRKAEQSRNPNRGAVSRSLQSRTSLDLGAESRNQLIHTSRDGRLFTITTSSLRARTPARLYYFESHPLSQCLLAPLTLISRSSTTPRFAGYPVMTVVSIGHPTREFCSRLGAPDSICALRARLPTPPGF